MGFPMTVERVISRNNVDPHSILADDIKRLAEDSVTLYKNEFTMPDWAVGYLVGRFMANGFYDSAENAQVAARKIIEDFNLLLRK